MKTGVLAMTLLCSVAALAGVARAEDNPFLAPYNTPWDVPPFDKIHDEHYMPAFEKGIADNKTEVAAIRDAKDAPTFANTVEALEESGQLLRRVSDIFFNINDANTDD
jgi:peptidyl-dipeptidase Dcp